MALSSAVGGAHKWVQVKGGQRPIKLSMAGQEDVNDLIEMVQAKAELCTRLDELQLYQSEPVKICCVVWPRAVSKERSRCNCCCFEVPCERDCARHGRMLS